MSKTLEEQPFLAHLLELRDRLLRMVLAVLVLLLVLFPFGNDIFTVLSQPVADALPEGSSMLATKVLSPFLTPLKLAFVAALFLAMPYLLAQIWGFIAPGLYQHERQLALPLLASSIALFYLGAAFAYFVVLPLLFPFLVGVVPDNVQVAPDIADFLDVAIKLFFAFGLAFEVPIATIIVVAAGVATPESLVKKRPYIIVGAFVVGMLLTPPDIISQTLLAVPIWVLFEVGVFLSRSVARRRARRQAEAEQTERANFDSAAVAAAGAGTATAEPTPSDDNYYALSEEEMDAELDRLEREADEQAKPEGGVESTPEESAGGSEAPPPEPFVADAVDAKLEQVMDLRDRGDFDQARTLLYEVLEEGNPTQVKVARNVLAQIDS